jgi:hypothetical protein
MRYPEIAEAPDNSRRIMPIDASILAARGTRRMPLIQSGSVRHTLAPIQPKSAYAGLLLLFGDWEGAHTAAQDIHTPDGSYWHAIVHRQEPDSFNSGYWFRQVGKHPIFPAVLADAEAILQRFPSARVKLPAAWSPQFFIDLCESAVRQPGSPLESAAIEIQHAEWCHLFDWCRNPM